MTCFLIKWLLNVCPASMHSTVLHWYHRRFPRPRPARQCKWRKGQQWRMDWHVISVPHKIDTNPSPKPKHQLAAKMRASHRAIMLMLRPARAAWGEPVMGQALSHSRRTFSGPLTTPVQTEGHKEALRAAFAHDASIAAAEVAELLRMHLSTGMGCWGRACVLAGSMQQCIRHSASIHAI